MKVIFSRNNSLASWLIRLFTWSRWHHCGVVVDRGKQGAYVIEASGSKGGVVRTPLQEFLDSYSVTEIAYLPCADEKAALDFMEAQVGKGYDWTAIFSFVFKFVKHKEDKWFCSEVIARASQKFRKDKSCRVVPELLWMLTK
jgi:uncharacterized protein YycO